MTTGLECLRDAAAYVLGELDELETVAFGLHMGHCEACRAEVDLLESASAAMSMMAHRPQPTLLRPRRAPAGSGTASAARRGSRQPQPGAVDPRSPRPAKASRGNRGRLARPVQRPVLLALLALGVLAAVTVLLSNSPPRGRIIHAQAAWRPGGAAVELFGKARARLLVEGMPPAPAGDVYEIWIERHDQTPIPGGAVFDVDAAGEAALTIPVPVERGDIVFVTPEPYKGIRKPSPPLEIQVRLP